MDSKLLLLSFLLMTGVFGFAQTTYNVTVKFTDSCQQQLGLSEHLTSDLIIYPNPSTGIINISYNEPIVSFQVFDLHGRILRFDSTTSKQINLGELSEGLYTILVQTQNQSLTTKIIIKR